MDSRYLIIKKTINFLNKVRYLYKTNDILFHHYKILLINY
jgi:hypothetical protein